MIEFEWAPTAFGAFVTAIILTVFAVGVGAFARFQGAARWYTMMGVGFGFNTAANNVVIGLSSPHEGVLPPDSQNLVYVIRVVQLALIPVWIVGVVKLLDAYGGRRWRWVGWTSAGIAAVMIQLVTFNPPDSVASGAPWFVFWLFGTVFYLPLGWMAAGGLIMALARRREKKSGQAILAAALVAYPISLWVFAGIGLAMDGEPAAAVGLLGPATFLATAFAWATVRGTGRAGIAVIAAASAFFVNATLLGLYWPDNVAFAVGTARIFDVVLVAYAILRLQYLGIDAKVRFTISKGTVAAVFIAVVFMASEGAQIVFGEDRAWLGLVAGGALIFVLAPLSRAADALAARAVPAGVSPAVPAAKVHAAKGRDLYQALAKRLLADGRLSSEDQRTLAHTAEQLGIGAGEAHDLLEKSSPGGQDA